MLARFLFPTILFLSSVFSQAQELSQVTFASGSHLVYFSLLTEQGVLLRISEDGRLLEWGTEAKSINAGEYYAPRLQPFPGRIDYYGVEGDSISREKNKNDRNLPDLVL